MPTSMSQLQELLLQWNAIILHTPLVSGVIMALIIALVTWFLVSKWYKRKVTQITAKHQQQLAVLEQERGQLQGVLDHTVAQGELDRNAQQEQIQQLQVERQQTAAKLQHAEGLEKAIADDLQQLQTRFFIQQPLPVGGGQQCIDALAATPQCYRHAR